MTTPRTHYDAFSRALHWLTAITVIGAFILGPEHFGRAMRQGLDPATRLDIVVHESLGVLVVVLTLLRLLWVAVRPAQPQFEMPDWMHKTAKATHGLLWLMLLAVPVSAFLALGSAGHPLTLLGGVRVSEWPAMLQSQLVQSIDWGDVHGALGDMILWLSGLHAVAAIYHHTVLKDGVLLSMLRPRR